MHGPPNSRLPALDCRFASAIAGDLVRGYHLTREGSYQGASAPKTT